MRSSLTLPSPVITDTTTKF